MFRVGSEREEDLIADLTKDPAKALSKVSCASSGSNRRGESRPRTKRPRALLLRPVELAGDLLIEDVIESVIANVNAIAHASANAFASVARDGSASANLKRRESQPPPTSLSAIGWSYTGRSIVNLGTDFEKLC